MNTSTTTIPMTPGQRTPELVSNVQRPSVDAAPPPSEVFSWRRAWRFSIIAFLCGRLFFVIFGFLAQFVHPGMPQDTTFRVARMVDSGWWSGFSNYERFDAVWFLQVADHGYSAYGGAAAFFPGYPLLIRALTPVTGGHDVVAATVLSNAALLVALVLLYRLTCLEFSEHVARRTIVLLLVNPVSYFFYAPYSEPLFLALTVAFFLFARRGQWLSAALVAGLASSTRSVGVLLVLALAAEAWTRGGRWRRAPRIVGKELGRWALRLAVAASGFIAYLGYWAWLGDAWRPFQVQSIYWFRERSLPWEPLARGIWTLIKHPREPMWLTTNVNTFIAVVAVLLAVLVVRRMAPSYAVFTAACLLAPLVASNPAEPLLSVARFDLVIFPLTWAIALLSSRRHVFGLVVATSGTLLAMNTMLFVSWHGPY
jgi:hypothetical protein